MRKALTAGIMSLFDVMVTNAKHSSGKDSWPETFYNDFASSTDPRTKSLLARVQAGDEAATAELMDLQSVNRFGGKI